jgi:HD-GYP domain-containing protein (c-di-GMP phosphodiesterase class II)
LTALLIFVRLVVLIRHHHENINGTGFPDKLAGMQIPIGARILAYADQLDKRCYQWW